MTTNTVRMNITLPADLAEVLKKITAPRRRSQFVAEAVGQKIKQLQDHLLDKSLKEGYQANKKEGLTITQEFESSDLEDWNDY